MAASKPALPELEPPLRGAAKLGKKSFARDTDAAAIRSSAAWMLHFADSANIEKAPKGLVGTAKSVNENNRKAKFKEQPSSEKLRDNRNVVTKSKSAEGREKTQMKKHSSGTPPKVFEFS